MISLVKAFDLNWPIENDMKLERTLASIVSSQRFTARTWKVLMSELLL